MRFRVPWDARFTTEQVELVKAWAVDPPQFHEEKAKAPDDIPFDEPGAEQPSAAPVFKTYGGEFCAHLKLWELVPVLEPLKPVQNLTTETLGLITAPLPVTATTPVGQMEVPKPYSVIDGRLVTAAQGSRWLQAVDEVQVLEDSCTDVLQRELQQGWRLLAICPHANQRRPDYVLGRSTESPGRCRRCGREMTFSVLLDAAICDRC